MFYIHHHLGLGDHIICNGLVRNIVKLKGNCTLFVKPNNLAAVQYMYRDLVGLAFETTSNSLDVFEYTNNLDPSNFIHVGFHNLTKTKPFDVQFYELVGLNPQRKITDFYMLRDSEAEKKAYEEASSDLSLDRKNYVVIHEDVDRGFIINKSKLPSGIKIVSLNKDVHCFNLFHTLLLFENAKEIHTIESSPFLMVDCIRTLSNQNLFLHRYSRLIGNGDAWGYATRHKNWTLVS